MLQRIDLKMLFIVFRERLFFSSLLFLYSTTTCMYSETRAIHLRGYWPEFVNTVASYFEKLVLCEDWLNF